MASCRNDELASDLKHSASVSEQLSQCEPDAAAEEPQSDMMNATVKSQKSGKFRRTALTFFGVRKGICILPSFFGGRSKNQSRWSSKKGIGRSKTHDGLSKAGLDDNQRSGNASAGDLEYHTAGELPSSCHSECSHPTTEQKCLSLTRHKRGLRSFFHSIKHHRNHRNAASEKNEMIPMSSHPCMKAQPVDQDNTNQYVTECLVSEPDVPDFANVICDISVGPECIENDAVASDKSVIKQESLKSVLDDEMPDDQSEQESLTAVISSEYEESFRGHSESCLNLQGMPKPEVKLETSAGSSDQLNMIFGDVASLKSFDSLTGCGDIIADQDDDSITESTVSGERSRNAGKRTSCYLTYQGGGEEMASPDFDEDCLHDFWENDAAEDACYNCNEDHTADLTANLSTSSHHMDLMNSNSAQQASGMDTSSIADVLTPQSEHQESVPTSDEGYYDSTTPGPEEGQEKTDRIRAEGLPRDSYSGDALYELFAPDESLISPHYENKSKLPGSKPSGFLGESGDVTDPAFLPDMDRLQIGAEMYKVQDFLEMPSICSKSQELTQFSQQSKGLSKNSNLNSRPQALVNKNNMKPDVFDGKGNMLASTEKRTKSKYADAEKRHGNITFGNVSDPDFEAFCEPKEQDLEENKPVALPYRNINPHSTDCDNDLDDSQTVCFSQALVDYTKRTQLLSDSSHSVDGLEMNSAFTPNMQGLPTIVTFDVVDMHNEGEYDEQMHMDLEEDISSPYQEYQEFEESYLQKDAFAECDYQMLDLYEQNLLSNAWAIASLPRHMGLTRVSQSMPSPLSLDRRSRSLDTESLELKMPDKHRENRTALGFCPQTEMDCKKDSFPYRKKNVLASTSDVRDSSSSTTLSWQTRSEMALSSPLTDEGLARKIQSPGRNQANHKVYSSSSSSDFSNSKSRLCSEMSDGDLRSQSSELCNRQCHHPLQSDSCLPHSTFVFPGTMGGDLLGRTVSNSDDEDFCKTATNLQSYSQCDKSRSVAREGMSNTGSPLNSGNSKDEVEMRKPRDFVCPVACNKPEPTLN
ncbi:APC membrane recruitment protein 1-like [Genypterus blacodes]|uniref:APC membrane recruitment protein 1-like n=1 Tax=Genypterus blacodes TaxID=154954 RepID=UPI003F76CB9B